MIKDNRIILEEIGLMLRAKRLQLGIPQHDVCKMVNISRQTYIKIEMGDTVTDIVSFAKIISILSLSADDIFSRVNLLKEQGK